MTARQALLAAAASGLLGGGCAAKSHEFVDVPALTAARCAPERDYLECVRPLEAEVMRRAPGVTRDSAGLRIAIPHRAAVVLRDSSDRAGVRSHFVYAGFSEALEAHLVDVLLDEGRLSQLVVRRTGRIINLDAIPVPSPDRKRLLTVSWDTEAGYVPNRIQIFRLSGDSLVLEWEHAPTLWGPDEPVWLDNATVQVTRRPAAAHPDPSSLRAPLRLMRVNGRWEET